MAEAPPPAARIAAGRGEYPVFIEPGGLADSWRFLGPVVGDAPVVVITQRRIRRLYGRSLLASWPDRARARWYEVPQGEGAKSMAGYARLLKKMARDRLGRDAVVVALGGGVVGDLAGFVAATFMRGVAWVQVPTSLLAQVDSSVGGKVAVNLPQGKNLVGAFYPPDAVLIDPRTLETLPRRERLAGCAEVAKYGLIRDAAFFARCEAELPDPADYGPFILASIRHKAAVVAADEREGGVRRSLNLGHTLGHALEAAGGYSRYVHGEAVAMGTRYVYRLAARLGAVAEGEVRRVDAFFRGRLGCPPTPDLPFSTLAKALARDKKNAAGKTRWILPTGIGRWRLEEGIDAEVLEATYRDLVAHDRRAS